ncbi:hypothetical protein PR202_gb02688 [Eleusine coracana subsp. coracana]|uniref:Protein kinase domain-containing protein n=1 Tax=Eleusine coracana subsp. coracana TaxID=191504 RepID=A0AAV5DZW7_ELECO|nr:hypothetical protein PR202_gb02688 [Eleusine coracana subsp. coracana]
MRMRMAASSSTCGGGRRGRRSPPALTLLSLLLLACFVGAVGGAQLLHRPPLEVRTYSYASFEGDANSAQFDDLAVLKDASIHGGALQLTPDTRNVPSFLVNKSGSSSSATHSSSGASTTQPPPLPAQATARARRPGEGLAFLVAPSLSGPPPGSHGGYLGLTNATLEAAAGPSTNNKFVAIEFDTVNQTYDPPNGNHVGLNLGSVVSNKTANLADFNIPSIATTESTARNYTVWVQYDGPARHLTVYMGLRDRPRPATPVLDAPLDLSAHVPDRAYLGFAAATGADFQLNCILDWSLSIEIIPEKESRAWVVVVAVVVPLAVIVVAVLAFFLTRTLRARRSMERRQERLGHTLSNLPGMPREFKYEKLRKATRNFDERQKLGRGGYGEVYKGLLPADGAAASPEGAMEVAVKKFTRDDARSIDDFLAEVDIINRLRHKNIVPLIGWCYKKGQLLLVYEYMPNGSLDQHLFRRGAHAHLPVLSWASRYAVVCDVAAGLHYVHHEYTRMVLHRDIKASNVLLDASFRARLGDFGLARVVEHDKNSYTDLGVAGTRGFIAPEYSVGHKASRATDVFAFGALVLEVVTGRLALQAGGGDPRCPLLSDWVWQMHGRGALLGAVDQSLGTAEFDADEAARLLLLALACSNPNPADRPTMPEVMQVLSKAAPAPEVPQFKPTFVWPPEGGGAQFQLSDIEMASMTTTTSGGGGGTGNGTSSSAMATYDTSFDSMQHHTAPNTTGEYFAALSSGR